MKVYKGYISHGRRMCQVEHTSTELYFLRPHKSISFHSPEFAWGYDGNGPAQLALSMLVDHLGGESVPGVRAKAEKLYQQFKAECIQKLPGRDGWTITSDEIERWISETQACGQ